MGRIEPYLTSHCLSCAVIKIVERVENPAETCIGISPNVKLHEHQAPLLRPWKDLQMILSQSS